MRSRLSYNTQLRLFLIPFIAGSLVLVLLPALATFAIAFTEYNSIQPPRWTGFSNFVKLYESSMVWSSIQSTVLFLLIAVPLRLTGALLLALLLQSKRRLFGLHRSRSYFESDALNRQP
jgi:multiple sugar transport system permease protein